MYSDPDVFDPDPLVRDGSPGSGSFYHRAKLSKKNLDSYFFVTSLWLFIYEKWCKCSFRKYWTEKLWKKL